LKDAAELEHVLSVLEGIGDRGVLVPDTSSLVEQPDPMKYRPIAGRDLRRSITGAGAP